MYKTFYLIALMLIVFAGCKNGDTGSSESSVVAIPVNTETIKDTAINKTVSISGDVSGNTTVRLGFLVGGKINYIAAKEGQTINSGQLVASLDPQSYSIAKQLSDVQEASAFDEFNRLKILHDRNSLSESDFSKITFSLQQARLQQQLQQKNLNDTKLYSPIGGVLIKKLAEEGEIVGVGTPLFVISDIKKVKVLAYVPEDELHFIQLGQAATLTVPALAKTFEGKVIEVGSAADETSRAFTIKILIDNSDMLIRPGMIAEAQINANTYSRKILAPAECISHDLNNQNYLFVVDKLQHKAFKRKVVTGKLVANRIEIIEGLNPGEMIITDGQTKLTDGSLITIK